MTVDAWVIEVGGDDRRVAHGVFRFLQLPAQGNRLKLPNSRGTLDVMGVVAVEHVGAPCRSPEDGSGGPSVTLLVQWIEEDAK